jgi:hypothetical protein
MNDDIWLPWADYAGLTQERLLIIGDLIRVAREEALGEHRPEKGETNWSLGVRQFERMNYTITWATQQYPWLYVVHGAGGGPVQYVFTIGGHAVRVCRGDADEVANRYQEPCIPELQHQQLLLLLDQPAPLNRFLRIAVENDQSGAPAHIYLDEMDTETGQPIRHYMIPAIAENTTVAEFSQQIPPVEIPPVAAEPIEDEEQDEQVEPKKKTGSDDQ